MSKVKSKAAAAANRKLIQMDEDIIKIHSKLKVWLEDDVSGYFWDARASIQMLIDVLKEVLDE